MIECLTCHGRYEPVLPDGLRYFHVCPPLSAAEARAALQSGTVTLTPAQRQLVEAAQAADLAHPLAAELGSRVDAVLDSLALPRPDARDENVVRPTDLNETRRIKADGKGVKDLGPAPGR